MNCEVARTQLIDLVYEEATNEQQAALRAHLDQCEKCRAELKELQEGARWLDAASPAPSQAKVDVASLFARHTQAAQRSWRAWRAAAVAAAASAAVLLVTTLLRLEIHSTHLVVSWRRPAPAEAAESSKSSLAAKEVEEALERLREQAHSRLAEHARRLSELDQLVALLARQIEDDQQQSRLAMQMLQSRMSELRRQSDLRWRAVGREFHHIHLANIAPAADLAEQGSQP